MRVYTKQHKASCGIELHARTMYRCILNQDGEILRHRTMQTRPEMLLKAIAPYREDLVGAVACLCPWDGLADLCAQEQMPCVLGHALSRKAIHGGKATNDTIAAQKIAVLLRGGRLPQAYGSPAEMRAPRELLRRRVPLPRHRAALLAHLPHTTSQYHLPESGQKIAYQANREGGAERFPDPAVPKSVDIALALRAFYDQVLRDVDLTIVQTATQHDAQTLSRRQSVPGIGKMLS
jgi:hypothetical protein